MSTLIEIEAAVDRLPYPEQEILLEHLACKLGMRPPLMEGSRTQHAPGPQTPISPVDSRFRNRPLQKILDDIAAERC
jgi:hypothetical protein